ncbi:MAG: ASCH domain-containing protein [Hyphomonas sp.]|jgi:hypothetical protein|nr:ASCH domain-containing protein [Hyphomonas sp.]
MTPITKALIIDQPWIDLILSGAKTWEMRGTGASHRGWFGLIRKGSGQVVGVARLTGSGQPLSTEEMVATIDRHHIPEPMIRSGAVARWTIPWHLADARPLARPVPYRHPSGAVTWVNLEDSVSRAIAAQMDLPGQPEPVAQAVQQTVAPPRQTPTLEPPKAAVAVPAMPSPARPLPPNTMIGETTITAGNLKNSHFYLRGFLHHFPDTLIGGRDASPPDLARIEADGMPATRTDICPTHRFFRDRSWTRQFFAHHDAAPGDRVQVHQVAPRHYRVSLVKG